MTTAHLQRDKPSPPCSPVARTAWRGRRSWSGSLPHELSEGNWRIIGISSKAPKATAAKELLVVRPGQRLRVTGRIAGSVGCPLPGRSICRSRHGLPYRRHVCVTWRAPLRRRGTGLHARHAARSCCRHAGLRWVTKLRSDLRAWQDVQPEYRRMKRSELESEIGQEMPNWGNWGPSETIHFDHNDAVLCCRLWPADF